MTSLASFMPPLPGIFIPKANPSLPAVRTRYQRLNDGRAVVTFGETRCTFANADSAWQQLEVMEARGQVTIMREVASC